MISVDSIRKWLSGASWANYRLSRAAEVAQEDDRIAATHPGSRFSHGTRPVIRWIKGDGLDDPITRAAIGQATRIFGDRVDYCLCTNSIYPGRARSLLEWSTQPVEWRRLSPEDNQKLADALMTGGCPPEHFGYWWKWFPERVREAAPEWILDGDMVITGVPKWFDDWAQGRDVLRMTQDDRWPLEGMYGSYVDLVDEQQRLYSGLISLPPHLRYMHQIATVLAERPLASGHDGRRDMCEQGVLATAFQKLGAIPIPLHEFPFARAFENMIDFGLEGDRGFAWGYHFGNAFARRNLHFERLVSDGTIFSRSNPSSLIERFTWLGGFGQWGVPGWSMPDGCTAIILKHAEAFIGRKVLELGTSRGRLTAMLASMGCHVTTVDRHDRGAAQNLFGLGANVIVADAHDFLRTTTQTFDLIVADLHGNSISDWKIRGPLLKRHLSRPGMLLLDNAALWKIPEWHEETGVRWFLDSLRAPWTFEVHEDQLPGVAVVTNA